MALTKEDLEGVAELLKKMDEYRLVAGDVIKKVMDCGSDLRPILEALNKVGVDMKAESVKRYQYEHDFTREEALLMVVGQKSATLVDVLKLMQNISVNPGKEKVIEKTVIKNVRLDGSKLQ